MTSQNHRLGIHRKRNKSLGLPELIAIALGGMIGGGIFTVLGIAVAMVGVYTPVAIIAGGILALLAAYAYVKLAVYYKDEGATYSFFKRTFPQSSLAASLIGWWVMFGYISTLALYSYTFASYALSGFDCAAGEWARKSIAGGIILLFTLVNLWSVKGMGKLEDIMVYSKIVILFVISFVLINHSQTSLPRLLESNADTGIFAVLLVASLTFVAYEGFQLVINAVNEIENPGRDIPRAIYSSIFLTIIIYVVISLGAMLAIPFTAIIENQESALASGAGDVLGHWGTDLVILGALLATSSAISGTLFGASRQMAVIAADGYMPEFLSRRRRNIPVYAIISMAGSAFLLVLAGNLELILEFGSVTFLLVSLLMAYANFTIRSKTKSSLFLSVLTISGLLGGMLFILYYELQHQPRQLIFISGLYVLLTVSSWGYSRVRTIRDKEI